MNDEEDVLQLVKRCSLTEPVDRISVWRKGSSRDEVKVLTFGVGRMWPSIDGPLLDICEMKVRHDTRSLSK